RECVLPSFCSHWGQRFYASYFLSVRPKLVLRRGCNVTGRLVLLFGTSLVASLLFWAQRCWQHSAFAYTSGVAFRMLASKKIQKEFSTRPSHLAQAYFG